jgi:tetratricopeptide (TPR) repeat protein
LAYGPNINDLGYAASPDALTAMQKAKALYNNCTPVEKALVDAMQVRYSVDTTQSREVLNQLYADAMKAVSKQFPASEDAAALYADALMVQHPWDFYDHEGKAKSWTPEIVNTLEALLQKNPKHPGAAHYYIHAIEASDHPEKGMTVAKELPSLMPGVSHLVHMPSHIYIRSGYYNEGVQVNEAAVKSYYNYLGKYAPVVNASFLYEMHNLHMQATCANMDGRFAEALKLSNDCRNSIDSSFLDFGGYMGGNAQYLYMTPVFTLIRFGKWEEILNIQPIPEKRVYANLIWHYARGLAFARKQESDRAVGELALMRKMMNDAQMLDHPAAFNPAIAGAGVAEKILEGIIAEEDGNLDNAIEFLSLAMGKEDNMLYNEPKDWVHPVREYLGVTYTKAGRYREAEKMFRQDLQQNPNNGWSLTGLAKVMLLQGREKESIKIQQEAKKAFARTDVTITAAVF